MQHDSYKHHNKGGTLSHDDIAINIIKIMCCMYIKGKIRIIVLIIVLPSYGVSVGNQQYVNNKCISHASTVRYASKSCSDTH